MHVRHTVSVKAALYSADGQKALVMHYPKVSRYGLPGGHLERNELPDEALPRELKEELGIDSITQMRHVDFFLRGDRGTSVILAYTAVVPADTTITPSRPKKEYGVWVTKDELRTIDGLSEAYAQHVLNNWP